jgi:hypothetical protein
MQHSSTCINAFFFCHLYTFIIFTFKPRHQTLHTCIKYIKGQQIHFGFMDAVLLYSGLQHVVATHGRRKVGENNNTGMIKICPDHSTV